MEKEEICYYVNSLGIASRPTPAAYATYYSRWSNVLDKTLNLKQTFKRLKLLITNKIPPIPIRIRFLIEKNHQKQ